jgi:hypothetical protein
MPLNGFLPLTLFLSRARRPQRSLQFPLQTMERVVPNTLTGPNANRLGTIGSPSRLLRFRPAWLALFVEGGDTFARFV